MEPGRVASVLENYFYNPRSITRATREFTARSDDVIVACNPATGDLLLLRLVQMLNALKDEGEFNQVMKDSEHAGTPWIESKFVDGNPDILNADQPLGYHRVFKTHMAAQGLNTSRKGAPLYVTCARHPVDVRVSWFDYLKRCHELGASSGKLKFIDRYKIDDFVDCTATTAQINPLAKILTLEHIMLDWFAESQRNRRVFQVFYENLITEPRSVISELGTFMSIPPSALTQAKLEMIAKKILEEVPKWDPHTSADNGEKFTYASSIRMRDAWNRALESSMTTKGQRGNGTYEQFYTTATGLPFPFPKTYAKKPPGKGPLDKVGRDIAEKCVLC